MMTGFVNMPPEDSHPLSKTGIEAAIQTIKYSRLRSFGSYENETIGIEVAVDHRYPPEKTLEEAISWVNQKFAERQAEEEAEYRRIGKRNSLQADIGDLESHLEGLKIRWGKASEFLAKHGIDPKSFEDIPF